MLLATHGMVSPKRRFFNAAFGRSYGKFLEVLAMPDRYIIHRERHRSNVAAAWRELYRRLAPAERDEFLLILEKLNKSRNRESDIAGYGRFADLLEHYYPGGATPHD